MHAAVIEYVDQWINATGNRVRRTLDVGSYNVNGSCRSLMGGEYIGLDYRAGPGVDIVADGNAIPFSDNDFELIICTEMLEHDAYPWLTMAEMARVCKPGGYIILTTRGYDRSGCTPVHDYPNDYWRFSIGGMVALIRLLDLKLIDVSPDLSGMQGVMAVAKKQMPLA